MEQNTNTNNDIVNHPSHYEAEAITISHTYQPRHFCELFGFNLGNAFKYLFRRTHKGSELTDLKKAENYLKQFLDNDFIFEELRQIVENINRTTARREMYEQFVAKKVFLKNFKVSEGSVRRLLAYTQSEIENLEKRA